MLDWVFEAIVQWIAKTVTQLMDAVSGLFLNALGTDMTAMEEYFPFVVKAFAVLQYTAWALLFIITVWQLFRAFGGPIAEAENPWALLFKSALCALLIGYAKPIFLIILDIARAPYTALLDVSMDLADFTFAGIEKALQNGLISFVSVSTVVGSLLIIILLISLGWNYFKLLLESVERYILVCVLFYTSPLAYTMGASKTTSQVFKSWCRMIGSQLLLLIMNVWFLRAFNSSVGQYLGNGGALSNGQGSVFLWLFCALAFLKTAQRFDSYLASLGLNAAQTGSSMGVEMLMAARAITGAGGGFRSAGSLLKGSNGVPGATGAGAPGLLSGFSNKFKGNSFVRDAVVQGGKRMGAGGAVGMVGRAIGGIAAKNGATLNGRSISTVATRPPNISGSIGGEIADRSVGNYIPQLNDLQLSHTQITGGHISTNLTGADGKETSLNLYNADQYERPIGPHSVVTAADGSQWYQTVNSDMGADVGVIFAGPKFEGNIGEAAKVAENFPTAPTGTMLRTVQDGVLEATQPSGNSMWFNSAFFQEPDAPHTTIQSANGVNWYAMQPHAAVPEFEKGEEASAYNQAQFNSFMPGYQQPITSVENYKDGRVEVRHKDGSGTMFYDATYFAEPRGNYQTYDDNGSNRWYAIKGEASVDRKPVYDEDGKPVYDGDSLRTVNVPGVRYPSGPSRFSEHQKRDKFLSKPPNTKGVKK